MAVKNTGKTVGNTESMEENKMEEKKSVEVKEEKKMEKEELRLIYIGPTLPAGQLKCNKIFIGTMDEIKTDLSKVLEKYPIVEKMLVPVKQLAEKKDKVKTAGNILNKYYTDIVSSIAANQAKEG